MAPPERLRGKCSGSIVSRQQYIECCKCNMHYHRNCINVVGDAYNEFMTTGLSAYICKACERDTASTATKRTTSEVARPNAGDDVSPALQSGEFASVIQQLCLKIDSMTARVGELRADNAPLRQQTEGTTELLRKLQVNSAANLASLQLHLSRNLELLYKAVNVNCVDSQGLADKHLYSTMLVSDGKQNMPSAPRKDATTDKREGAAPPLTSRPSQFPGANRMASKHEAPPKETAGALEDDDGFRAEGVLGLMSAAAQSRLSRRWCVPRDNVPSS